MAYPCSSARSRGKGCGYKKCTRSREGLCSYARWSSESVNRSWATSGLRHTNISVERLRERTYSSYVARHATGGSVRGLGNPRHLDREAPVVYPEPYIGVRDHPLGLHGVGYRTDDHRTIHGVALLAKDGLRAPARAVEGEVGELVAGSRLHLLRRLGVVFRPCPHRTLVVPGVRGSFDDVADGLGGYRARIRPFSPLGTDTVVEAPRMSENVVELLKAEASSPRTTRTYRTGSASGAGTWHFPSNTDAAGSGATEFNIGPCPGGFAGLESNLCRLERRVLEVRRYRAGDEDSLARLSANAFGEGGLAYWERYYGGKDPRVDPDLVHLVEEDGDVRATGTVLPLEVFVDGRPAPMGGIAAVATHAAYRRRGYAGELMRAILRTMRERGMNLSMLWPFAHAFYRAYGWELAGEAVAYTLKPTDLPTSPEQKRVRAYRERDL